MRVGPDDFPLLVGGTQGIVDGYRGSIDYRGGDWQGFEGRDVDLVVDLGGPQTVTQIKAGFLQNTGPRIFLPSRVSFDLSMDGERFDEVASLTHDTPLDGATPVRHYFEAKAGGLKARCVRVRVASIHVCPPGHERAGMPAWVYVDEILVR